MNWEDSFRSSKPEVRLITEFEILRELLATTGINEKLAGLGLTATDLERLNTDLDALAKISSDSDFHTTVAAARTCYAQGLITPAHSLTDKDQALALRIADSIWEAGHQTPFMHQNFVFLVDNVSRELLHSILHSHPFYNSEQVSQRYRKMTIDSVIRPRLNGEAEKVYDEAINFAFEMYNKFREDILFPAAHRAFIERAPHAIKGRGPVLKKTQEVARYFLPIGTHAHLYHTINFITLARYWKIANEPDVPTEFSFVVKKMVELVCSKNNSFRKLLNEPVSKDELLEEIVREKLFPKQKDPALTKQWAKEFDQRLGEGRQARLVDYKSNGFKEMASAIRDILGLPESALNDRDAVKLVLDPNFNKQMGNVLTLDHVTKLSRAQYMLGFTFMIKLSHTADCQEQRQRMMPAARPILGYVVSDEPDYILPPLVEASGEEAIQLYREGMQKLWDYRNRLIQLGVKEEMANYLLPNATALRFRETGDLLNWRQKDIKRECLNAQEEIGKLTLQQRLDIEEAFPELKGCFGPPCYLRFQSKETPYCPEGNRYCLVPVWKGLQTDTKPENERFKIENVMFKRII